MANSLQSGPDRQPPLRGGILRLTLWLVALSILGALVAGRIREQNRWYAYANARASLIKDEWNSNSLLRRADARIGLDRQAFENQLGIKLKPARLNDLPATFSWSNHAYIADKLSGQVEVWVWLDDGRVEAVMGFARDEHGRLWHGTTFNSLATIWDLDGRSYSADTAPTWLRLSVCKSPAWMAAIDYAARFAWIAWIPFGVLALLGLRHRLSAEIVLAAALAAFASAAMDVWLGGQPISTAHIAPLYAGFPLSAFLLVWTQSRQAGRELAAEPAVAASVPDIVGDRPDWAGIIKDVHCPLCGYNLRGLERPLCPECGLQFRWVELFEAARTQHPYLYEHQPCWNLGAFLKTMFHGLNPGQFWRQLSPVHRTVPRRILVYFLLCQVLVLAPMLAGIVLEGVRRASRVGPAWPFASRESSTEFTEMVLSVLRVSVGDATTYWWVAFTLWPLVTLAVLMVCQTTFRRAGVKLSHVVRAVVYSGDVIALAGVLMAGVCLGAIAYPGCEEYATRIFALITLTMFPLLALRLATACRLYLRIRHAWPTTLATQAVFLLGIVLLRVVTWAR